MTLFRDNNKLLFPLLGLALLSSGGLSTSALSFKLSLPLSLSRGGGNSSPLFNSISFKSPDKVLNLESQNASNYKFSLSEAKSLNQSLKIEAPQESLTLTENFDINQTKQIIPKLFNQSDQKEKVLALQKKVQAEGETQSKKLKNKEDNYKSAVRDIQKHKSGRYRREASSQNNKTLSKDQKEAIRSYYESFSALSSKSQEFLNQFSKDIVSTPKPPEKKTEKKGQSAPSGSEIDKASKEMKGEAESLQLFGGTCGQQRKDSLTDVGSGKNIECEDQDGGGANGEQNPYKHFFVNREAGKVSVRTITEPQKKLYEMTTGAKGVFCGIATFPFGYLGQRGCGAEEREKLKKQIEEAKSSFDFSIGTKYLEGMKQA